MLPCISTASVTEVVLSYEWWHNSSVGSVSLGAGTGVKLTTGFIIGSCKGPDVFARVLSVCDADSINILSVNNQLAIR